MIKIHFIQYGNIYGEFQCYFQRYNGVTVSLNDNLAYNKTNLSHQSVYAGDHVKKTLNLPELLKITSREVNMYENFYYFFLFNFVT